MGLPHQQGCLAEGEQSTRLGVPCGLAPVLGPEHYCPLSSLRVILPGPWLWTRSHSVIPGRGPGSGARAEGSQCWWPLEVDVEWWLELGLCLPSAWVG